MRNYKKDYEHLVRRMRELQITMPAVMPEVESMQRSHSLDGAITAKTKGLIALGISVSSRCEGCIAIHLRRALNMGASRPEIMEVLSVAIMMGGFPSIISAAMAVEGLDAFEHEDLPARLYDRSREGIT